jgi:hypothetical protein
MAYYNLQRMKDQKTFTGSRASDQAALFYFSILVGEELRFDGSGSPPYLLGKRAFAVRPVDPKTPVYRMDAP